ncbi:MAG: hypothetical protein L0387_15095 [Acidobacteria bacterium]|nr:hypothetical protein [Acidobacteriota bacterium]MCI0724626.1 hypothetical protein [Acidobacteriota bacterium]
MNPLVHFRRLPLCLGLTAALFTSFLQASEFSFHLKNGAIVEVYLELSPSVDDWKPVDENAYSGNGYALAFEEMTEGARSELKVKLARDGQESFTLEDIRWNCRLNDPRLFAIWTYGQDAAQHKNYRALASESFGDLTAPNSGIPFAMAVGRDGTNLLAAGLLTQSRVVNVRGWPQENGEYQLHLETRTPIQTRAFSDTLYTETSPRDWFSAAKSYAQRVDKRLKYKPFPVSPACYYPLYDVWYWAGDNTDMSLYWNTLLQAKELGFQSYLFDSGWESYSGELSRWLEGSLGNYSAPEDKLPGFADFLRAARQDLGMNVILWLAPYALGRESSFYEGMRDSHVVLNKSRGWYHGGDESFPATMEIDEHYAENVNLCPRTEATPEYLKSLFSRVAADYQPDGYWLDFQETVPFLCEAQHNHATSFAGGFYLSQSAMKESILKQNGGATVEMRYPGANLNNKRFANLWQSIDFPQDFDAMRLCNLMMRPFSQGVVMGTDEMFWPMDADNTTVARYVATTVFSGVPAIGANLLDAPQAHAQITKAWLAFYHAHQTALTRGSFRPIGDFVEPDQKIESAEEAFVYLRSGKTSNVAVGETLTRVFIANCTNSDQLELMLNGLKEGEYRIESLNFLLQRVALRTAHLTNRAELLETVPQGGMLAITRK